ncbi:MAG: nucleoside/nucleotide kinase family protein [Yoonia sp.]|nr:nucleoside/nucleotide kinase family protein [Yoonia sp.]
MTTIDEIALQLRDKVLAAPRAGKRRIVALAGAPASGKSTLATHLAQVLCAAGCQTQVVPMDGFHLDNKILAARGMMPRKGAVDTFDVNGLMSLVRRLGCDDGIYFPKFDRAHDISIACAAEIASDCDTIIVEGNYLLLDAPVWRDLAAHWDLSIALKVPEPILLDRLVKRWQDHGLPLTLAKRRAEENDLINARVVIDKTISADVWV